MGFLRICKDMCKGTSMGEGSQNQEFLVKGRHNKDDYTGLGVYLGVPNFVETTIGKKEKESPDCRSIDADSTYTHVPKPETLNSKSRPETPEP